MDRKRYQNVSLSLARNGGCLKMPGDEQKKKVENHACLVGHYFNYVSTDNSNKNFILKYFRCRDRKTTETRNGMDWRVSVLPIPAFHHCVLCVSMYYVSVCI